MKDIRQSKEYAQFLASTGWIIEELHGNFYFLKKFPLIGSVIKLQRPESIRIKDIQELKEKYRAFRVIIEPKAQVENLEFRIENYKLSKSPFLPTKTLQIDLTKSENHIFGNLKSDARNAIKKTSNLQLVTSNKLDKFHEAWRKSAKNRFLLMSLKELAALKNAFGDRCLLLQYENSGAIFLKADETVYYWKAFTSPQGRKDQIQYKIVWEGIMWAKKNGIKIFDFEGVFDERFPLKNWKGFTHFKKAFGGKEVVYPGTFIK